MPLSPKRTSALLQTHIKSGAEFTLWNDMAVPSRYSHFFNDEIIAVRKNVGLTDMSGIKKFWITGDDADDLIDFSITRNAEFITAGKGAYTGLLNDAGQLVDDAIVFHLDREAQKYFGNKWLICTGGGCGEDMLTNSQKNRASRVFKDENLSCLMLQGPKSEDVILASTRNLYLQYMEKFDIKYVNFLGLNVLIARTSYSGEDGFEIFAHDKDVVEIWHYFNSNFKSIITKVGFDALDVLRTEAGLLFFGKDMTGIETPTELGLDFFVETTSNFRGKNQYANQKNCPNFKVVGISSDSSNQLGNFVLFTEYDVRAGIILSNCFSPTLGKYIGIAQVIPSEACHTNKLLCRPNNDLASNSFPVKLTNRRFLQSLD